MQTLLSRIISPLRRFFVSMILSAILAIQPIVRVARAVLAALVTERRKIERREMAQSYHYINDRRRSLAEKIDTWLGFESPNPERTLRIHVLALVATLQVAIIVGALSIEHREVFLLLPTFCLYAACVLAYRKYRLELEYERN